MVLALPILLATGLTEPAEVELVVEGVLPLHTIRAVKAALEAKYLVPVSHMTLLGPLPSLAALPDDLSLAELRIVPVRKCCPAAALTPGPVQGPLLLDESLAMGPASAGPDGAAGDRIQPLRSPEPGLLFSSSLPRPSRLAPPGRLGGGRGGRRPAADAPRWAPCDTLRLITKLAPADYTAPVGRYYRRVLWTRRLVLLLLCVMAVGVVALLAKLFDVLPQMEMPRARTWFGFEAASEAARDAAFRAKVAALRAEMMSSPSPPPQAPEVPAAPEPLDVNVTTVSGVGAAALSPDKPARELRMFDEF